MLNSIRWPSRWITLIAVLIIGVLVVVLSYYPIQPDLEQYSELWLLDQTQNAELFPFTITIGQNEQFFLGVTNHLGHQADYVIYVKIRNQTQEGSTINSSSSVSPVFELRANILNGETWRKKISISFLEFSRSGDILSLKKISINDVVLTVDVPSTWDSENNGFFYNLFFELWLDHSGEFDYHNRSVGLWLNGTVITELNSIS